LHRLELYRIVGVLNSVGNVETINKLIVAGLWTICNTPDIWYHLPVAKGRRAEAYLQAGVGQLNIY
jgi:hypothetical protein